ncbi:terpene cyclase/mutase family protein [Streptomyces formicae]|uniref:Terpene cyclase/mutase family protein n=1 Tax=Streptomyces formicae TaxID=1616117 RepID=A0ABY3WT65_9ACTN|nr:terpene cyclase/mutase family protein [Streptomyces formicae]UNM14497.1 terpene cyclase/mutase family protein [Streptomyces formicae]
MDTADDLAERMIAEPYGRASPSAYETGRLVSLAPWLPGHAARLRYLLDEQRPDALWGGPGGYALVPSLSAVEALLTVVREEGVGTTPLLRAATHGLHAVADLLARHPVAGLPDTAAVELIVPALTEAIERHMQALRKEPVDGLEPVALPADVDASALHRVRRRLVAGAAPPHALLYTLEALGEATAPVVNSLAPVDRIMCASPAAMAAWLHVRHDPGVRKRLEAVATAGPVPSAISISVFERSWVLAWLLDAGAPVSPPDGVVQALEAALGPAGTPAGEGLPLDGDVTPAVLHALALLERPQALDVLRRFETPTHFCCYPGERTPSATVNAHVLEALSSSPAGGPWREAAAGKATGWLAGRQHRDGHWEDKWHASPYYATACCALALHRYGGTRARAAVGRATEWVSNTQRADGGWGIWESTAEETSYALRILLSAGRPRGAAARRGAAFLQATDGLPHRPLWHAKDLYTPGTVVESSVLAARYLAEEAERAQ